MSFLEDSDHDNLSADHRDPQGSSYSSEENHRSSSAPLQQSPPTPTTASFESPLLPPDPISRPPTRSISSGFISSPLNPNAGIYTSSAIYPRSRPASRGSMHINRIASEESQALSSHFSSVGQRGSMVLYRLASEDDALLPPNAYTHTRNSVASGSGDSIFSISSDSKYPLTPGSLGFGRRGGLIPYMYDPDTEGKEPEEEEDLLHLPDPKGYKTPNSGINLRGFFNIGVLLILITGLIALFVLYPVITYFRETPLILALAGGNVLINGTGQAPLLINLPSLIDADTPQSAMTRTGFDQQEYELVFSDEFNVDGRTFYPGDDPYWEAVDLWYWATNDLEWYDPMQISTGNGSLNIVMEDIPWHGLPFRSGMLQSWNKFCFSSGYIEVSLSLPGPNADTQGYWPGAWTMGNLGRPGYGGTTDGTWPYTYDSCDVGTFPNQTYLNQSGPAAALNSPASKAQYDMKLSVLDGQRLSACTCPGGDHPGPSVTTGRGAPEIDMLEAQKNKVGDGAKVSQSAQFAPFTHDYLYDNSSTSIFQIYNSNITQPNPYHGSPVQQALSALTDLPANIFTGSGAQFTTVGFEYWADPNDRENNFITWQTAGQPTMTITAGAVGPDTGPDGSQVGQRLIPEEPMSIILNLGMSTNWQHLNFQTMEFPAVMMVDYVRVYQRKGQTNINCDPPNYPTANYINNHSDIYSNANLTSFGFSPTGANYTKPLNSLYDGCS